MTELPNKSLEPTPVCDGRSGFAVESRHPAWLSLER